MELSHGLIMRPEQRQLLTPRMIQSMEILQLPLALLEERIEQELQSNPVLEMSEGESEPNVIPDGDPDRPEAAAEYSEGEKALVVKEDSNHAEDFDRLERISEYLDNEEWSGNTSPNFRATGSYEGERDKKMDAMANTAARGGTL